MPAVEIAGPDPIPFHVDGEVVTGGPILTVRVRPAALRVRVPGVRMTAASI
jgi:diacylglycerol kinase family enzyme